MGRGIKKYTGKSVAKDLRTPKYKMRVIKDKRMKEIIKQINKLLGEIR